MQAFCVYRLLAGCVRSMMLYYCAGCIRACTADVARMADRTHPEIEAKYHDMMRVLEWRAFAPLRGVVPGCQKLCRSPGLMQVIIVTCAEAVGVALFFTRLHKLKPSHVCCCMHVCEQYGPSSCWRSERPLARCTAFARRVNGTLNVATHVPVHSTYTTSSEFASRREQVRSSSNVSGNECLQSVSAAQVVMQHGSAQVDVTISLPHSTSAAMCRSSLLTLDQTLSYPVLPSMSFGMLYLICSF